MLRKYVLIFFFVLKLVRGQRLIESSYIFDREFVGAVFAPYAKIWENGQLPYYNSYSLEELKIMLKLIAERFTNISTYGMGVAWWNFNNNWDKADSNCNISKAAAELNLENSKLLFSVSQGIWLKSPETNATIKAREIENAFLATEHANNVFSGTVWGVTYPSEFVPGDIESFEQVLAGKARAHALGVKIGSRVSNCTEVLATAGHNQALTLLELDYVICIGHPIPEEVVEGPTQAAAMTGSRYKGWIQEFRMVNPNLDVILETGWPTKGNSYNGPAVGNTIKNMETFWVEMGKWASDNRLQVLMLEAFDQPTKSRWGIEDPNDPSGRFGAEGHYGWWRRTDNSNITAYVEKIYEIDPAEAVDQNGTTSIPSRTTTPILSIIIPTVLLVLLIIIGYMFHRLRQAGRTIDRLTEKEIQEFEQGSSSPTSGDPDGKDSEVKANNMPYNKDYEIPKNKIFIEKERILGEGQFGTVFKGRIEIQGSFEEVALKTTKSSTSVPNLKSLLSELKLMIYIGEHPCVIRLFGAYTEQLRDGIVYIATELCGQGSLEGILRKSTLLPDAANGGMKGQKPGQYVNFIGENTVEYGTGHKLQLTSAILLAWSLQIAKGMDYLESRKVIHSDLASRNILVANDLSLRITDFGLSRRLYEYTSYVKTSQEPLPWRWMAYESLRSLQFSSQSDVWSYGVTLWEIFSLGDIPYPGLSWDVNFVQQLEKGLRMPQPKYSTTGMYSKILECWHLDPLQRPTFAELAEYFD